MNGVVLCEYFLFHLIQEQNRANDKFELIRSAQNISMSLQSSFSITLNSSRDT
jgi:hypothetical protein